MWTTEIPRIVASHGGLAASGLHPGRRHNWRAFPLGMVAVVIGIAPALAQQGGWLRGGSFIGSNDLPPEFAAVLKKQGGRMTAPANSNVSIDGTITDANGSRPANITVQATGLLRYQEGKGRAIAFGGAGFQGKGSSLSDDDWRVADSLLANFPDSVPLQLARNGGALRRIGAGFRTDDGTTPNYQGPWWTLYAFAPGPWQGLSKGQPLQQELLIAIDEQSGLLSEVRLVENMGKPNQKVTQTRFLSWFQQGGQWFPGAIVRLENGQQVLSFQSQQASVGAEGDPNSITQP